MSTYVCKSHKNTFKDMSIQILNNPTIDYKAESHSLLYYSIRSKMYVALTNLDAWFLLYI